MHIGTMIEIKPPFSDPDVEAAFASFPEPARQGLLALRRLIFEIAATTPEAGALEETLKWGQPAYVTATTKSGSTIRLGLPKPGGFAIYTHCRTSIIADFRSLFPKDFVYEGNRAIHFKAGECLSSDNLRLLIRSALTYHLR